MINSAKNAFVGIDSGTQSCKVLLADGDSGAILGSGSAPHKLIEGLPPGHLEQHPQDWFTAMEIALLAAIESAGIDPKQISGIGVSGQQHGFVPLDDTGEVIRPAKLWCDTSTAKQCNDIVEKVGGPDRFVELVGNGLPPGFTASKIAWLKENEPDNFARLKTILLPHDYLNYRLTGRMCMEYGDASGTALLDVRSRQWSDQVANAIDDGLPGMLPELIASDQPCAAISAELADRWGMAKDVLVSAGGGDNMMAAIGTGNVSDGVITVSLGTSGTIFAYSSKPVVHPQGDVAGFCDSTGGWLPLICTMNVTVATELTRSLLAMNVEQLEKAAGSVIPGSDGLLLVPYFEGERTPNVPDGTGVWFGANRQTHTPAHFARAAMEGATLGLHYGMEKLAELGVAGKEIRLTGGGSNSATWRQIVADVFSMPVVCLEQSESAAFGAAIQAVWCHRKQKDPKASIAGLTESWVKTVSETRCEPRSEINERYRAIEELHKQVATALNDSFSKHRRLVTSSIER